MGNLLVIMNKLMILIMLNGRWKIKDGFPGEKQNLRPSRTS
jgi:hypothetical protein